MNKYRTLRECREVIHNTFVKLNASELVGKISVHFSNRLTTTLGSAHYSKKKITLSGRLYPRATEQERYQNLIHEACHIVQRHRWGASVKSHGKEWKSLMLQMGLESKRCHQS